MVQNVVYILLKTTTKMKTEGSLYYPLFKFFIDEHNLTLLDSDIQEIINKVNQFNQQSSVSDEEVINFISNKSDSELRVLFKKGELSFSFSEQQQDDFAIRFADWISENEISSQPNRFCGFSWVGLTNNPNKQDLEKIAGDSAELLQKFKTENK